MRAQVEVLSALRSDTPRSVRVGAFGAEDTSSDAPEAYLARIFIDVSRFRIERLLHFLVPLAGSQ